MSDERHTGGLGDAPIEERYRETMRDLARQIDEYLNGPRLPGVKRKIGFALLMFDFDEAGGRCNYISNADRLDMKVLLREQLRRFEGQAEPPTGHA